MYYTMTMKNRIAIHRRILFFIKICITLCLMLPACDDGNVKPFTVGVVDVGTHSEYPFETFKAGMADLGYVEGTNIIYLHNPILNDSDEAIDREIKNLLSDGVDILYTISNNTTMRAKKITKGTGVPVVFGLVTDPVKNGFVESITHPGGNITGIYSSHSIARLFEWMIEIAPDTKFIYLPYNLDDQDLAPFMELLENAAETYGIEIYPFGVQSLEEIIAMTNNPPQNSAIIFAPDPKSEDDIADFLEIAVKRKIPVGSFLPDLIEKTGILTIISSDPFASGKRVANLADQILKGAAPADLPVESTDSSISINLKTAEAIGLQIPNVILLQADRIVR